jgi:uncharacterized phiE125 gp8 family phage protein
MKSYGTLVPYVSSPEIEIVEPFDAEEAKVFLRSQQATDTEDDLIDGYISVARATAEFYQERDLVRKKWNYYIDSFCAQEIQLRQPLVSVELVRIKDSTGTETNLVENTDYIVDTVRGLILPPYGDSWPSFTPWPSSAVLIRYTAGYSATDAYWQGRGLTVKQGMRALITHLYWNRNPIQDGVLPPQEIPFGITPMLSFGKLNRP